MKRLAAPLFALLLGLVAFAPAAHADPPWRRGPPEWVVAKHRARAWHRLHEARERFYDEWDGNPWEQARFERWYQRRAWELREEW